MFANCLLAPLRTLTMCQSARFVVIAETWWRISLPGFRLRFRWFQVSGYAFAGLGLQIAPSLNSHRFAFRIQAAFCFVILLGLMLPFEIGGHQLTLFTHCLVMLKTINMGERQESVVGILSRKYIIQCLFSRQIIY